jgi:parvulin-like peptidyl-prolyl isomerase
MSMRAGGVLVCVLAQTLVLGAAGCRQTPATPPASGGAPAPAIGTPAAGASTGNPAQPGEPSAERVKPVPAELPAIIARVNGEAVERWELESVVKQAEARAGAEVPPEERDTVMRQLLDDLITYHMLAQESRARKITVTEADVDAQMKNIRQSFPTDEAFRQAVAARGLTEVRLRQQERRNLEARRLVDLEVTSKVAIADSEVDAFYKENVDKFKQGETYHVSHIFVAAASDAPAATKQMARARAEQTLKDLRAGADFATMARERSDDTTATDGGDLGFVGQGDLPPDFEAVMFSLKPGALSDVVELGAGFHIIKLHETRAPRTVPLEEVRADVREFLTQSQRNARLDAFVDAVRGRSIIEILV